MFTKQEKMTILTIRGYGEPKRTYDEVAHLFNETYPNQNPISKTAVWRIVKLFEEVGSTKNRNKSGRPKTTTNDEKSLEVMQTFVENHGISIREAALQHDVGVGYVHNILKINKFRPHKILLVQELSDDDFDRRLEFSEIMIRKYEIK